MTRQAFIAAVRTASMIGDKQALRLLKTVNPRLFNELVEDAKRLTKLRTLKKATSKSDERREKYMAQVTQKRKLGLNH